MWSGAAGGAVGSGAAGGAMRGWAAVRPLRSRAAGWAHVGGGGCPLGTRAQMGPLGTKA